VPEVEFPRTNDAKMLRKRYEAAIANIYWQFALRRVLPFFLLTGVALAVYVRGSRSK
jgi:hypothetical protein